jgi:hypothetical protein
MPPFSYSPKYCGKEVQATENDPKEVAEKTTYFFDKFIIPKENVKVAPRTAMLRKR